MRLYIFPGSPTLFYQQVNQNSCILSSLSSAFHYMGNVYASEYIIRRKQRSLLVIQTKGQMHFCRDILIGHYKKNEKIPNYRIEEWHTSMRYDIFGNQSNYPTIFLLLDTWHRTNHCIAVWGKCIFDSNLEVAFPLTQDCLNYTCHSNYTDEIKLVGVLHAIISVPPEVFQIILNMK